MSPKRFTNGTLLMFPIFPPEREKMSIVFKSPATLTKKTKSVKKPANNHTFKTQSKAIPNTKKTNGIMYMTSPNHLFKKVIIPSPPFPAILKKLRKETKERKNIKELKMYLFTFPGRPRINLLIVVKKNKKNSLNFFITKDQKYRELERFFLLFLPMSKKY